MGSFVFKAINMLAYIRVSSPSLCSEGINLTVPEKIKH